MDKYGFHSWHDYFTFAFLTVVMLTSSMFLLWERHARHRDGGERIRRQRRAARVDR